MTLSCRRAYVHHTVEGEYLWQVLLRTMVGSDGIELPIPVVFHPHPGCLGGKLGLPQAPGRSRRWTCSGPTRAAWSSSCAACRKPGSDPGGSPGAMPEDETRLTVRDVVLIHLRHMDGHTADIADHPCEAWQVSFGSRANLHRCDTGDTNELFERP
ncbi:MAG: hypothetical protein M0C28_17445 [Candidatus Moduliflexus flocculans]|nr:hypothetical protein [Candidatus Moduliflexus flocculans]